MSTQNTMRKNLIEMLNVITTTGEGQCDDIISAIEKKLADLEPKEPNLTNTKLQFNGVNILTDQYRSVDILLTASVGQGFDTVELKAYLRPDESEKFTKLRKRIVAAFNYCAGIPTSELESGMSSVSEQQRVIEDLKLELAATQGAYEMVVTKFTHQIPELQKEKNGLKMMLIRLMHALQAAPHTNGDTQDIAEAHKLLASLS